MAELFQDLKEKMIEGMQHTKETATQKGANLQEQAAPAFERATEKVKDLKNQTGTTASGSGPTSTTTENETSGIPSELGSTTEGLPPSSAATDRDPQLTPTDSATPPLVGPPAGGYMQGAAPSAGDPFKDLSTGDAASQQAGSAQPLGGDAWRDAGGVTTSDAFRAAAPETAQPPRPAGDYGLSTVTTSGEDADAVSTATPQEQIRRLGGADKKFVGGHEVAVNTGSSGGGSSGGAEGGSVEGASDDLRVWRPVSADQAGEVTTTTSQQRDADALAPKGSAAMWRDAGGVATSDQFRGTSGGGGDMLGSSGGSGIGSGSGSAAAGTVNQFREPSSGGGADELSGATPDLFGSGATTGTITTSDQFREPTSGGGSGADLLSGGTSGDRSGGTVTTSDQFRQPVDTGTGGEVEMSRDLGVTGSVTTSDQFRGSSGSGDGGDGSGSASEHFTPGSGAVTAGHSDYGLPRGGFGNGTGLQETSSTQPEQQRSSGGTGGTGGSEAFVPRESATEQAESAVLPLDTDLQRVSVSELASSGGSAPQASGSSSSEQQRGGADAGASEFTAPLDALAGDAAETHEPSLLEKVTSVFTRS